MYFILLEGKFYWNSTPMFGVLLINVQFHHVVPVFKGWLPTPRHTPLQPFIYMGLSVLVYVETHKSFIFLFWLLSLMNFW